MSLNDVMKDIQQTKWTKINNFAVSMTFANVNTDLPKVAGVPESIITGGSFLPEVLDKSVIAFDTANLTNMTLDAFIGFRWNTHVSRDELYRFSLTFRDFDNMVLYKTFSKMYQLSKGRYYDSIKMNVTVFNDVEYVNTGDKKQFLRYEGAIIENISQVQFNNTTENQIAEFTIGFKCPKVVVDDKQINTTY